MPTSITGNGHASPPPPPSSPTALQTMAAEPRALARSERPQQQRAKKRSLEYNVKTMTAGGLAGCVAKTVVGPLDRVKILFQASNPRFAKYTGSWTGAARAMADIYRDEGPLGLFRGHSATLLRIFPYAGVKFLAYEQIRAVVIRNRSQETPVRRFVSGSLAGCASVVVTYPLEVIRVRLAFETKKDSRSTISSICRRIYNEKPPSIGRSQTHIDASSITRAAATTANVTAATVEQLAPRLGIANFYRGFTPTMWGMLPYAGASFLTHDTASDLLRHPTISYYTTIPNTEGAGGDPNKPAQLKYWAELTSGGFAGFVSQTVSYPLEVIRRRMQVGGVVGDGHRLAMAEVAKRIWMERGWRGFFVGLGIGYVKVIPLAATSFFVYERAKYYLGV